VQNGQFGPRIDQLTVAVEEPAHDFIVGAVTTDGQDHIRAFRQGVAGEFDSMAGEGRKLEVDRFKNRLGSQTGDQLFETQVGKSEISS